MPPSVYSALKNTACSALEDSTCALGDLPVSSFQDVVLNVAMRGGDGELVRQVPERVHLGKGVRNAELWDRWGAPWGGVFEAVCKGGNFGGVVPVF